MSKYRIKEIVYENGSKRYIIYKKRIFWYPLKFKMVQDLCINIHHCISKELTCSTPCFLEIESEVFTSIEQCKDVISWVEQGKEYDIVFNNGQILYTYPEDEYSLFASPDKSEVISLIDNQLHTRNVQKYNYLNVIVSYE